MKGCFSLIYCALVLQTCFKVQSDSTLGRYLREEDQISHPEKYVKAGGLFPFFRTGASNYQRDGSGIERFAGFRMAITEINNRYDILPNITIKYSLQDSKRDAGKAFFAALQVAEWGSSFVMGPASSGPTMNAQLILREYKVPQISYSATSALLSNTETYPYFSRTPPSDALQARGQASLVQLFNWTIVATVSSTDGYGAAGIDAFHAQADEVGITVLAQVRFQPDQDDFTEQLNMLKNSKAKVFVMFCAAQDASPLLEQAYKKGLTGEGFVWIGSDSVSKSTTWDLMSLSEPEKMSIMKGYLGLNPFRGDGTQIYNEFVDRWVAQEPTMDPDTGDCSNETDAAGSFIWRRTDVYEDTDERFGEEVCGGLSFNSDVNSYAPYSYDGTYVFAHALHRMIVEEGLGRVLEDGEVKLDGAQFLSYIRNVSFPGVSGQVELESSGDRTVGVAYEILNHAGTDSGLNIIGIWRAGEELSICDPNDPTFITECHDLVWSTADNSVPVDWVEPLVCSAGEGMIMGANGNYMCEICAAGSFPLTGQVDNSTGEVLTLCRPCPAGSFTPSAGKSECTACVDLPAAQNYYQDLEGQTECKRCPMNTFRLGGQRGVAVMECTCKETYWQPELAENSLPCEACPAGGVCHGTHEDPNSIDVGKNYRPYPMQEFWGVKEDPSLFLECEEGMCEGGEEFSCVKGYEGRLCSECLQGHWSIGDDCGYKCKEDDKDVGQAFFMIGATSCVIMVWLGMNRIVSEEHDSLDLLLQYLQIGDIISSFQLHWTTKIANVQEIISVVNFEVDLVAIWKCYMFWNYSWSFILSLILPTVVGTFKLVTSWRYLFYYFKYARNKTEPPPPKIILGVKINKDTMMLAIDEISTVFFSFLLVCYNNLCLSSFSTFVCMEGPDNTTLLEAGPVIKCWEGDHIWMICVSVATLFVYVLGIPYYFARVLLNGMKNNQLAEQSFLNRYGFMYTRYKVEYAGWELLMILRNFLMCAVSVFFSKEPLLQSMLGIVVLGFALACHMHAQPFVQERLNVLEFFSIVGNGLYIICGVLMDSSDLYNSTEYLIYIIIIGVTVFGLVCFSLDLKDAFALTQATRNLTSRLSRQFLLNPDSAYGQVRSIMQLAEDAFDTADTDGNGTLSWQEVRIALTTIHSVSDEAITNFMKMAGDSNGEITRTGLRVFFLKRLTNFNTARIDEMDIRATESISGRHIGKEALPQLVRSAVGGCDVVPLVETPSKGKRKDKEEFKEKREPRISNGTSLSGSFYNLANLIKNRRWSMASEMDLNPDPASEVDEEKAKEEARKDKEARLMAGNTAWKRISTAIGEVAPGKKQKGQKARLLRVLKHKANAEMTVDELLGLSGSKEDLIREMAFTIKPRALRAWATSSPSSSALRAFHALDHVMTPLLSDSAAQSAFQLDPNAVMYRRFVTAFPFVIDWLVSYATNKRAKQLRNVLDSMVDFYKAQGWTIGNPQGEFSELIVPMDTAPFATWLMATDDLSRERCKFLLRSISTSWKKFKEEQKEKSVVRKRVSIVKKRVSVLRAENRKDETMKASIGRTVSIQNRKDASSDDEDEDEYGRPSRSVRFSKPGSNDSYDNIYGNVLANEGEQHDYSSEDGNTEQDDEEGFDSETEKKMRKFVLASVDSAMKEFKNQLKAEAKESEESKASELQVRGEPLPRRSLPQTSKAPTFCTVEEGNEEEETDEWVNAVSMPVKSKQMQSRRSWHGEEADDKTVTQVSIDDLQDFDIEFLKSLDPVGE